MIQRQRTIGCVLFVVFSFILYVGSANADDSKQDAEQRRLRWVQERDDILKHESLLLRDLMVKMFPDSKKIRPARFNLDKKVLNLMDHVYYAQISDCGKTDKNGFFFPGKLVQWKQGILVGFNYYEYPQKRVFIYDPVSQEIITPKIEKLIPQQSAIVIQDGPVRPY